MADAPILVVNGLLAWYGESHILHGVSFDVLRGETLGLVGESGCGKSTTGRCILRLIEPSSGEIWFNGADVTRLDREAFRALRRDMQIIFQDPYASLNPRMTVGTIIAEPLVIHGGMNGSEREARVAQLLEKVGMQPEYRSRYPHEFSGGQRQRIGVARALATNPRFLVLDEPVSALDVSVRAQVINLLEDLKQQFGVSYLFISHDLSVVEHIADRVVILYLGRVVEVAPTDALFRAPNHPYTKALLANVPRLAIGKRRFAPIAGELPSPFAPPSGCHFHTRCPHARERCSVDDPALEADASANGAHATACHFWREIATPEAWRSSLERSPNMRRIERLQAAFVGAPPVASDASQSTNAA